MPIVIETRCTRRPRLRGSAPHAAMPARGMSAIRRDKCMSRMSSFRRHEKAGHRTEIARNGNRLPALAVTTKHFDVGHRDVANCGQRDGAEFHAMELRR
jgi:hypothetical protein